MTNTNAGVGHFLCHASVGEKCADVWICAVNASCSYRFPDGGNICTGIWLVFIRASLVVTL